MKTAVKKFTDRYWGCFTPTTIDYNDNLIITGATGCLLRDERGKEYLDFCSQAGVSNIGHNHPFWLAAYKSLLETIEKESVPWYLIATDFHFQYVVSIDGKKVEISQPALAERLKEIAFGDDTRFIQQISGATTNNSAIKFIDKLYPEKKFAFAFKGAFQGRQGGALGCTYAKPIQRQGFSIGGHTMEHLSFVRDEYTLALVMRELNYIPLRDYAFIIFELIQGEGGVNPVNEYTIQLLKHLQDNGVILVCDDVQEGFGRTGAWLSYENFNIVPDIITVSKAMGGGDPIGAALFNAKNPALRGWDERLAVGWDSSTFQWNPHAVFNAIVTMMIFEKYHLIERARDMGGHLKNALEGAMDRFYAFAEPGVVYPVHNIALKGIGLHYGIEFQVFNKKADGYVADVALRDATLARLRENGIITLSAGNPNINPTIRFMPPLIVTKEEIATCGNALAQSLIEAYQLVYKK
ncbi:MAG: hypothetical protein COU47_01725 [Candidatus Niyogibacteria bacterium CG10_big_fil_rev_8_21_14_0_10_46_36]|uniref:Diaminobutyrate--2-oxoglutarate transaminase n=1 Tax=Candidatus Niyogibacteria bacterium CG10_big_fil_rev_8_21_14_0_10_46_36 TaxID=1974726 RepID=A0A2H0TDZ8_9BACT|nr:MAG: hypothetical protein COU47_01725 [Candidatus Niyogibacteria bacterium CG10_big_fil_rev_8_21_14_0_10_46_36]